MFSWFLGATAILALIGLWRIADEIIAINRTIIAIRNDIRLALVPNNQMSIDDTHVTRILNRLSLMSDENEKTGFHIRTNLRDATNG